MQRVFLCLSLAAVFHLVASLIYDPEQIGWNLNQNKTATDPLDYWGQWSDHPYNPSPANWRFPFYTLFLDRFINGDPSNDDINGTAWEHDLTGTQLRHGGDIKGLLDTLDYLTGMGIKGIYIAGSPFINMPWGADAFSPLDLTLLDPHFGVIQAWRDCIDEMHSRGMYVILDNTMSTMGDLIGFEGYLNVSTPLAYEEHNALWKTSRRYHDFTFNNTRIEDCEYPRFWDQFGEPVVGNGTENFHGCKDSDFDQYGDIAAFDIYPEWQRQISKFASVQDRLREWKPSVRTRIEHFSCMQIAMLDIDGFRMDKGQQITVDAQGEFSDHIRQCAAAHGKDNFFIPGEIVSGNAFGAVYIGRGKEPSMRIEDTDQVVRMTTNTSDPSALIRGEGKQAFDSSCFHYSVYRSLTRFLGMDGDRGASGETPFDFVEAWNDFIRTNDMMNANTGVFDPRHMYGAQNQDVFRWPTVKDGTYKQNLATFIITILLPGIPMLEWGEEQAFYVHDNTASNYVFGRQAMSSATAWQDHGCYFIGNGKFTPWNTWVPGGFDKGCKDDWNSLDHRDPAHPIRNIMKNMFEMRARYPVLNDGFYVKTISKHTYPIYLPGSQGVPTEMGLWSVLRSRWPGFQDFTGQGQGNQSIWLLYHNEGVNKTYEFDCNNDTSALLSPFDVGTTVKNLLYPYESVKLVASAQKLELESSTEYNGCLAALPMTPWGYKAYVPIEKWMKPSPVITHFSPGHDYRILSNSSHDEQDTVPLEFHFSDEMNCKNVVDAISVNSTTGDGSVASIDKESVNCRLEFDTTTFVSRYTGSITGQIPTAWKLSVNLVNVSDGVHSVTVANATTEQGNASTNSVDHFLFRIGQRDNPIVFPRTGNYSSSILHKDADGSLYVSHKAAGADKFRYSTNWASTWSDWQPYNGRNTTLKPQKWSGTKRQEWEDEHVMVQYWGQLIGSSDHLQQGDLKARQHPRRYPHMFVHGSFNEYGYDSGLPATMHQNNEGLWQYDFMAEWPAELQANVWGVTPDGHPDLTRAFGDVDNDTVLDLLSPVSLLQNVIWITDYPPAPHLAYRVKINDGNLRYTLTATGSRTAQILIFTFLAAVPLLTAIAGVWAYQHMFYAVKLNRVGQIDKHGFLPFSRPRDLHLERWVPEKMSKHFHKRSLAPEETPSAQTGIDQVTTIVNQRRRTVLIATMEYDIEDWGIKIKIGGLGVMASLMSKHLQHQDLVWVVPCVGGIDYPIDQRAKPMTVTILDVEYTIQVQYHHVQPNITYVLLDADIFRQQTAKEPYPRRMDDMESAIYYSAWNSCIAEAMRRFPIDLYHINDYHGALAPLHLLPRTIPCCLSLHNAEFQGLWAIRTPAEMDGVCRTYNIAPDVVRQYVQFGEVFNLLHAGASYLRVWQKGYGAVGVSEKYGKRSFARYPIFWGLTKVGSLPNPDPSDLEEWDKKAPPKATTIDSGFEAERVNFRCRVQEWAGLDVDPEAELFAFVGRWSIQKGIDLVADVFPAILEDHPKAQLICVGPIIDIYGKFAALKLGKLMEKYPGRVYSKPEFVQLPPFFHSGVEFGLMPSRDEPFGLVAVEFGRKGALCVGSRVGGLGSMPGWWFTIESTTTRHLISQFKMAIQGALASKPDVRKTMRARSAMQRYPVAQWKETLGILQDNAIRLNQKQALKQGLKAPRVTVDPDGGTTTPPSGATGPLRFWYRSGLSSAMSSAPQSRSQSRSQSRNPSRAQSPSRGSDIGPPTLGRKLGPGHSPETSGRGRPRNRLSKPNPHRESSAASQIGVAFSAPLEATGAITPVLPANRVSRITEADNEDPTAEIVDEYLLTPEQAEANRQLAQLAQPASLRQSTEMAPSGLHLPSFAPDTTLSQNILSDAPAAASGVNDPLMPESARVTGSPVTGSLIASSVARLSLGAVVKDKKDYKLQNVDPFFDDPTGLYYNAFEKKLDELNAKTSEGSLCVEEYLVKSERDWFNRFRGAKMGRTSLPASPMFRTRENSPAPSISNGRTRSNSVSTVSDEGVEQFLLQEDYKPPTGLKKMLLRKIGDWPVYTFLLAFGQIIAANSYQITLLTGAVGQAAEKLYIIASIYLITSIMWWSIFRNFQSKWVLTAPFGCYGIAFFLLGLAPYASTEVGRGWVQNVATAFYATASSSGAFFFSLNFGSEGSVPVATWSFRACAIQGTQQIYVVLLWFWGSRLNQLTLQGVQTSTLVAYGPALTGITVPIALLMWAVGILLFFGLPEYYRQSPGRVPSFYRSIIRRKVILWFFVTVLIQNFFLSAPYGRNWKYLWSSKHAPAWAIALLIAAFFIGIWALALWRFAVASRRHSWILPIFAIGLGAPRWAQMLWGTSGMGEWVPWALTPVGGALVGRSLWLWLGVLDALQGVGFGMILLQTLTRFHVVFTLVCAQVLGSAATIVARACAPNKDGPGTVFPNLVLGTEGLGKAAFWVGLLLQGVVCVGFFKFFRKEQLQKP